jgi:hypothetical protein
MGDRVGEEACETEFHKRVRCLRDRINVGRHLGNVFKFGQ